MKKELARNGIARALWATYRDFAAQTGVHGLRYITEDGRRPAERVLWLLVALGGLVGAGWMAATFWQRFSASPTRASVDTNHYPAWRLPFPAATLCNANRVLLSHAQAFVNEGPLPAGVGSPGEALRSLHQLLDLLQPLPAGRAIKEDLLQKLSDLIVARNISEGPLMAKLEQGCFNMLERCKWKGEIVNCSDFFEERKSFIGYCCSFNYRGIKEKRFKNGSVALEQVDRPVRRSRYYSHRMGLTVLLNPRVEDYFLNTLFSAGLRMLVHGADDFPDDTVLEKVLPAGREILLRVTASSSYCSRDVRALALDARRCVFPRERRLLLFPVYTPTNCLAECRMAVLRRRCGCVPYFYPEADGTPVCSIHDYECVRNHSYDLHMYRPGDSQQGAPTPLSCECPPLCNEVNYEVQFSSGDLRAAAFQRSSFFDNLNVTGRILFHFYFGNHVTVRTRRDVISSWNDLLSSLGGVFSLFLGCSFMSLIEMVYFFTLRLALRYRYLSVEAAVGGGGLGEGGDGQEESYAERRGPLPPLRPLRPLQPLQAAGASPSALPAPADLSFTPHRRFF